MIKSETGVPIETEDMTIIRQKITYEDIQKANEQIQTITLEKKNKKTGKVSKKEYAEVHQRVKAFRMLYPGGYIKTDISHLEDGVCVVTATVGTDAGIIATGTAYEKENSSYINETSYIENAETSAVGRALGFAGFGIDTSIASADEVQNAELNRPLEDKYITVLTNKLKAAKVKATELKALKDVHTLDQLTLKLWQAAMDELEKIEKERKNDNV